MKGLDLSFLEPKTLRSEETIEAEAHEQFLSHPSFSLAQTANPADYLNEAYGASEVARKLEFNKGTTTLAFIYDRGIVVAVDSRATQGGFIASQSVKKVIEINPYLLGTMAGGAADCKFWERDLGRICRLYELRNKERISVAAASKILANILFDYRGYGLVMGTMIVGWDKTGPNLFYVDSDGTRLKHHMFSVGSGSSFAYGVLDSGYRPDLSREEAIELGRRSIYHATYRDSASGGIVNVYHVDENGWQKISADDMNDLHDRYSAERGNPIRPIETEPIPA